MLEFIDFTGGVLWLAEPVFHHMPEDRPIRLIFKFREGRHSFEGLFHGFHQFGVLFHTSCADKPLFLAVDFVFLDLEGNDLTKLGHFGCG